MRDVQVMILAAGLSTRLWPLTADRGKPALPFVGRPLIRGMLDWLNEHGARHVVVNTHHQPDSIRAALASPPAEMVVHFSHEPSILGTAGCLAHALRQGLLAAHRTTLVVNGKLRTSIDLRRALQAHRNANPSATLILRTNTRREAFTTVHTDGPWVTGFGPPRVPLGERPLAFTGIHFLEPPILARAEPRFSDTVRDLYPPEIRTRRICAYIDDQGQWTEPSTLARYLGLQLEAVGHGVWADSSARVAPDAKVRRSVLGPDVSVGEGAVLEDAVLFAGTRVEAGAEIRGSVLGEGVRVPPAACLTGVAAVRPEVAAVGRPDNAPPLRESWGVSWVPIDPTSDVTMKVPGSLS